MLALMQREPHYNYTTMNKNKVYEKRARLYPVIVAMLIPLLLLVYICTKVASTFNQLEEIWNVAISIVPATLITGALTYGVKFLSRSTSKALFQFPLFKENETQMPTTELILWNDNNLSNQNKQRIHDKVKANLSLELMSREKEEQDEYEARLLIAEAVKQIRERTRDNTILFNYNCNFGFIRNFMGASIWALAIIFGILVINLISPIIENKYIVGALVINLISYPIAFFTLKQTGREYARQLFTAFIEL